MEGIRRMFRHMAWADRRLLDDMNTSPLAGVEPARRVFSHLRLAQAGRSVSMGRNAKAVRLFAHVLASERIWFSRLSGEGGRGEAVWPELSIDALTAMAIANHAGYAGYLDKLRGEDLGRIITYENQSGRTYRTEIGDILVHVAMHGSYHRGQIAAAVRGAGGEPVNTDYITFVRGIEAAAGAAVAPAFVSDGAVAEHLLRPVGC